MKFLIWFIYLAVASGLTTLLLSVTSTAATVTGGASAAMFFAMAIYGGAIFFARLTCRWWGAKSGHSPGSKKILHAAHSAGATVPDRLPGEIVEVYRQPIPKRDYSFLFSPGFIAVYIASAVLLVIVASVLSWKLSVARAHEEYQSELSQAWSQSQKDMQMARRASYDLGYEHGCEETEAELRNELEFYRDNAVIVTESGEKYHKYGCYHLLGSRYYIYNVELAESFGYTPCSDCWDKQSGNLLPILKSAS